jgi:hypothetical protein
MAWFANAGNNITRIFTGEVCLTDPGQDAVCLNRAELQSLKALISNGNNNDGSVVNNTGGNQNTPPPTPPDESAPPQDGENDNPPAENTSGDADIIPPEESLNGI